MHSNFIQSTSTTRDSIAFVTRERVCIPIRFVARFQGGLSRVKIKIVKRAIFGGGIRLGEGDRKFWEFEVENRNEENGGCGVNGTRRKEKREIERGREMAAAIGEKSERAERSVGGDSGQGRGFVWLSASFLHWWSQGEKRHLAHPLGRGVDEDRRTWASATLVPARDLSTLSVWCFDQSNLLLWKSGVFSYDLC